jgi:DNA-directed RNA polymerase subunit RPC12/RpoP
MNCIHCNKNFSIENLSKKGYQIGDIFGQRREASDSETTIPYICANCAESYPERQNLAPDFSFNEMELVYYLFPSHDKRNWGSALDYGVNKV